MFRRSGKFLLSASLALLFLIGLCWALFLPEEAKMPPPLSFEDSREALKEALAQAKEEYDSLPEDGDFGAARQKILFYETALDFSLSVWSGDFDREGASLYARIRREWEILYSRPFPESASRRTELEEKMAALERIFSERDQAGLLEEYRLFYEKEGVPAEESAAEIQRMSLRFQATSDGILSPEESLLIERILLLRESLEKGEDLFNPALRGKALKEKDRLLFEALLEHQTALLTESGSAFSPAAEESLVFFEELFSFAALILFLPPLLRAAPRKGEKMSFVSFLSFGALLLLLYPILLSLGMALSVPLFAPSSLGKTTLWIGRHAASVSFALPLFLRILLRFSAMIPFVILFLFWAQSRKKRGLSLLFCPLFYLFYQALSLWARLKLRASPLLVLLPFVHSDPITSLLPRYPLYLPPSPTPVLSFLGLIFTDALLIWLYARQGKINKKHL
ncbi:MAG: hypothetical protein IKD31_06915 [Clostridia bacterium]|nr:hypothetical protein [Clostridia bacterium]